MVGFEKALRAVKVIKDQIQYRSQSLLNLARGYFRTIKYHFNVGLVIVRKCGKPNSLTRDNFK